MLLRRFLIFEDISTIGNKSRHGGQRRRLLKAKGMHGIGAKAGDTEAQQIHDALDAILSTLEDTHINLREAFESFDRSANGSISIAEFASLIKTLGGLGKSIKKQMEQALRMERALQMEYCKFGFLFLLPSIKLILLLFVPVLYSKTPKTSFFFFFNVNQYF